MPQSLPRRDCHRGEQTRARSVQCASHPVLARGLPPVPAVPPAQTARAQLATNGAGVYNPHDRGRFAAVRGVHGAAEPLPASERGIGAGGADGRGLRYAMADERKIRVLVANPGLDGHDRGAKVIARPLPDPAIDLISPAIRRTPHLLLETPLPHIVD